MWQWIVNSWFKMATQMSQNPSLFINSSKTKIAKIIYPVDFQQDVFLFIGGSKGAPE